MQSSPDNFSVPEGQGDSPTRSSGTTLVGRTRELEILNQRLTAAGRGEGGVVLIGGEPGIGKSSFLREVQGRARAAGWQVLEGRAYDTEGMPPYLAFAEAIAQYVRSATDHEPGRQLARAAREVAVLVPELREHVLDVPAGSSLGKEADRYRLFEAVSEFFLQLSASSAEVGLLLCLDDLHWADASTLLLFQHLTRRLGGARLLVVGTYRSEEVDRTQPLFDVLAELSREQHDQRVRLGPLSQEETRAHIEGVSGTEASGALAKAIHHQSEGNPFFVQEIVRHLQSQDGGLAGASLEPEDWGVSEGVRQVIGRRLSRFGPDTQKVLECAAVFGDGFDPVLLSAAVTLEATAVHRTLEEAAPAGILREQENTYIFGHPIIRQVIYESLSLVRRQELHLCAARAIEATYPSKLDLHLSALTRHCSLAGVSETAKAADYATRAGDRAASVFAFTEALRLYDLALEAIRDVGQTGLEIEAAELTFKRAEALSGLGRWPEARAAFEAAASSFTGARRADAVLTLAGAAMSGTPDPVFSRRAATLASDLATELDRRDLQLAADTLIAACDLVEGAILPAIARYETVFAEGKDLASVRQHQGFRNFALGLYWVGRTDEAIARGRDSVSFARESHDAGAFVTTAANLGLALAAGGQYEEALKAFAEAREIAGKYGAPGITNGLSRSVGMSVVVHMATFDYVKAEAIAEEARELARSVNFILPVVSEGIDLGTIAIYRGDLARADELVSEVTEDLDHGGRAHAVLWRVRLACLQAELALARRDWREALNLSASAIERSRTLGRPKYEALALTTRGKALAGLGRKKDAILDMRQAVEVARPVGDPAFFLRAAAALLPIDGDEALATDTREAIERILANLPAGMKASFEAAEPVGLIYRLTGQPGSRTNLADTVYPDGLSVREVEVLRLIASGQSNREIAETLVLSVRTVERHIANVYLKILVHTKAQATAYAHRQGLI